MNKQEKKRLIIISCIIGIVVCFLIGIFVQLLVSRPPEKIDGDVKFFGLMNGEDSNKEIPITKADREIEYQSRSEITESMEKQIPVTIDKYLSCGDFSSLDTYLRDIIENYRDQEGLSLSIEDLEVMRYDIALTTGMNSTTATSLMQSYRNPKMLAAAMVYKPISCKYKSVRHGDSLMLPPPENGSTQITEVELTDREKESWLLTLNQNSEMVVYTDVKVYSCNLYGCEFRFVVGYRLNSDTWSAYKIYSDDKRTEGVFHTALEMQKLQEEEYITEETMDTALVYSDLSEDKDDPASIQ